MSLGRIDPSAGTATTSGGAPLHRSASSIHRSVEPGLTSLEVWSDWLDLPYAVVYATPNPRESCHDQRSSASSVTPTLLSIGELSERTGVPTTALRYYDELGLVRPAARAARRRRFAASAVRDVGLILFFREIGFSLAEIGRSLPANGNADGR